MAKLKMGGFELINNSETTPASPAGKVGMLALVWPALVWVCLLPFRVPGCYYLSMFSLVSPTLRWSYSLGKLGGAYLGRAANRKTAWKYLPRMKVLTVRSHSAARIFYAACRRRSISMGFKQTACILRRGRSRHRVLEFWPGPSAFQFFVSLNAELVATR
uniref:Uncharacterized protein n=1 Tax=Bionectria ochroleuca TaxID=29856 RepID=A0A0B7JHA1_BIOOC